MADRKELDQIKPAIGGVKLKAKTQKRKKPEPEKSKIINDVNPEDTDGYIEPPTEEAARLIARLNNAKQELVSVMREFNKLLNVKTLPTNKSSHDKDEEARIIQELIRAATTVDSINPGQQEGVLSLGVFATRLSLLLRDAGNELAYKVKQLEERISVLESRGPVEKADSPAKEYILKEAEKLGLKISVEDD